MPDDAGRYDGNHASNRLFRPAAEIVDQAYLAARLARQTGVTPVQDEPVMRMQLEFGGNHALKTKLDLERRIARGKTGSIGDAEYVRVHRHGVFAVRHVEHDVGGLAAGARQRFQLRAGARHLAAELRDQLFRQRDNVLRLVAVEPDGLDVIAQPFLAEREHLLRRVGNLKQRPRRLVDAGVGGLCRQHHRDQQRVGVEMFELPLRLRIGLAEATERLVDLGWGPGFYFLYRRARLPRLRSRLFHRLIPFGSFPGAFGRYRSR